MARRAHNRSNLPQSPPIPRLVFRGQCPLELAASNQVLLRRATLTLFPSHRRPIPTLPYSAQRHRSTRQRRACHREPSIYPLICQTLRRIHPWTLLCSPAPASPVLKMKAVVLQWRTRLQARAANQEVAWTACLPI